MIEDEERKGVRASEKGVGEQGHHDNSIPRKAADSCLGALRRASCATCRGGASILCYLCCCHPHLLELHLHDGRRRRGLRDGLFAFFDAGKTPDGISLSRIGNAQHATHLPLNAAHLARNVYASAPVSAVHAK